MFTKTAEAYEHEAIQSQTKNDHVRVSSKYKSAAIHYIETGNIIKSDEMKTRVASLYEHFFTTIELHKAVQRFIDSKYTIMTIEIQSMIDALQKEL